MKIQPLQTRCVQALNCAGLSDMHGELYNTHGPAIVRFVLRKARADAKRREDKLRVALGTAHSRIASLVGQRANGKRDRFARAALAEISAALDT